MIAMTHRTARILIILLAVAVVFCTAAAADSTFRGTYAGAGTFTFDRSTSVTEVTLPEGSDFTQEVKCIVNSVYSFKIDAPGYCTTSNERGKVRFLVQLEALENKDAALRDIVLTCGDEELTTYIYGKTSEDAIYEADIYGPGTFTIRFSEGASQNLPIKADLTNPPQKTEPQKPAAETATSPAPVAGIIAALGIAAAVTVRRH